MTRIQITALLCAAAVLAGCQMAQPTSGPDELPTCATVAAALQNDMGMQVEGTQATGRAGRRILGPGDMATMDFVPERLNLVTDARGRLTRAYCG